MLFSHIPEKSESARNGGCFDENSVVYDRNGPRLIKDLQVGDEIMSVDESGLLHYSEVVMFLDRDLTGERLYYRFETESGQSITTTPSHLLFVAEGNSTKSNLPEPRFAKDISVGHYLYTRRSTDQVVHDRIVKKSSSLGRGAYAPLTTAGNLVVNNVTASCYAVIASQSLAHWSFLPVRWAYLFVQLGDRLSGALLVKSRSSFSQHGPLSRKESVYMEEGIHWYPSLLYRLFKHLIPSDWLYS